MKPHILIIATLLLFISCKENRKNKQGDSQNTKLTESNIEKQEANANSIVGDDFVIHPIFHASMVIEHEGKTIYVDPYGGAERYSTFKDPDIVLITHAHQDHLNKETLNGLNLDNAVFVVPNSVKEELDNAYQKKSIVINNHEEKDIKGIEIEAIPMYNLPETKESRHKKGWGNGYIVDIDGERIYISGDTEDIPEMRHLKNIDIAFVCMNLPYTMTIEQAASAVLDFKPDNVYPFHFRGKNGFSDVAEFKQTVESKNPEIKIIIKDWYPETDRN
ncbi:MBL fold metallo-hydrolase [Maribacter ulvicola]|uniref:L-ascorbate metabolism protein UlaG, beta-lactamase superfamily n=1 Tax=Maribacter ulvicola TaxID=228959 RepID=A0A1N6QT87_9FLAO|nr:MBL fold metallo-hydrolase [Maribacter ulvicola]SIQ19813.1 L-ascorbate metabolism protein UlaG, beta-lactamase superfamily [Maribacter ulvicola]